MLFIIMFVAIVLAAALFFGSCILEGIIDGLVTIFNYLLVIGFIAIVLFVFGVCVVMMLT